MYKRQGVGPAIPSVNRVGDPGVPHRNVAEENIPNNFLPTRFVVFQFEFSYCENVTDVTHSKEYSCIQG